MKAKIEELSEEIAELQFEIKSIIRAFDKVDAAGMKEVEGEISKSKARIVELDTKALDFTGAVNLEKEKFAELKAQAADLDQDELTAARLALRPQMESEAQDRIRKGAQRISFRKYQASVSDTDKMLGEDSMAERHEERGRLPRMEKRQGPKSETRESQQEHWHFQSDGTAADARVGSKELAHLRWSLQGG